MSSIGDRVRESVDPLFTRPRLLPVRRGWAVAYVASGLIFTLLVAVNVHESFIPSGWAIPVGFLLMYITGRVHEGRAVAEGKGVRNAG